MKMSAEKMTIDLNDFNSCLDGLDCLCLVFLQAQRDFGCPNYLGQLQIVLVWTNHFHPVEVRLLWANFYNLDQSKIIKPDQNELDPSKTIGTLPKIFGLSKIILVHRRTSHKGLGVVKTHKNQTVSLNPILCYYHIYACECYIVAATIHHS